MKSFIFHGDALQDAGKVGEIDYLITDPPYPTGSASGQYSQKSMLESRLMIDGMTHSFIAGVIRQVKWKGDAKHVWMFCDWRQVSFLRFLLNSLGLDKINCLVWDKVNPSFNKRWHQRFEMVLYGSNVSLNTKGTFWGTDIIECKRPSAISKSHAFEKPAELVENLLIPKVFEKGTVLDPFCGTGGLLVGAKELGHDVVGIDIDMDFVETARERLEETLI